MFTQTTLKALEALWPKLQPTIAAQLSTRRKRIDAVHEALQLSSDKSSETLKGERLAAIGDKSKLTNIEVPICAAMQESAHAYLTGTFLTGFPLFAAVTSKANAEGAEMLTTLTGRDQIRFNWTLSLDRCMQDVLNYNLCAAEVLWTAKRSNIASSKLVEGSATTGTVAPVTYEGNQIKRIDPYNTFYDTNVEPSQVHEEGTYNGYVELLDYIGLKRLYSQWNALYTYKANINAIFGKEGAGTGNTYQRLKVAKSASNNPSNDWSIFWWGTNPTINMEKKSNGKYELVTLFVRLIPSEYHITDMELKGNPHVFKLCYVNGLLAYAETVVSGNDYLPLIIGQYKAGHEDVKSFVEYTMPMQDLSTGLITASLDSMRRAVSGGDRLFDPTKISDKDINNKQPAKNIPVKLSAMDKDFSRAMQQVPYIDNISPNFTGFMSLVKSMAENAVGVNAASGGSFTKGNRTLHEFDSIMNNSVARLQLGSIQLEGAFFAPIKEILKLNYLVYAQSEEINNNSTVEPVKISPKLLREIAPDYVMADGLMPSTKLANTDAMMLAVQAMSQNPQLMATYDVGGIMLSIIRQQGFIGVDDYKLTPEQSQQAMAMQAQQSGQPMPPTGEVPDATTPIPA